MKNTQWRVVAVRPLPDDIGVAMKSQLPDGTTAEQIVTNQVMDQTMERLKFISEAVH